MASTQCGKDITKNAHLLPAYQSFQKNQFSSCCKTAAWYNIPESTLRDRIQGSVPKAQSNAKKHELQDCEEQVLIQWILDLD
jgi:hypothetical protein